MKSLDEVSKSMKDEDFILTRKEFPKQEQFQLLRKRCLSLWIYSNSNKLNVSQLPPIEAFYSKLRQEGILDDDFSHAQKVWETFNYKTLKDYHMLYLKSDVVVDTRKWCSLLTKPFICNKNVQCGLDDVH